MSARYSDFLSPGANVPVLSNPNMSLNLLERFKSGGKSSDAVQMLCSGGSLRWTPAVPWAAVDYQISTMSTSVCTRLAATIERFRIATETEAKHLITLSQFILV